MKKCMLLGLLAALVGLTAQAQEVHLRADIPFAFQAGTTAASAGTYDIKYLQGWLVLEDVHGGEHSYLISNAAASEGRPSSATLIFARYGDRYFLREVWPSGSAQGRELPATKAEAELARTAKSVVLTSVLTRNQ